ncbi:zinc finger and SCAN domain-containing protein 4 [Carlito syrichta]|uniref:Zinc finger and SCAN domain-containing protein 4 n=1 Tax=Carlito syrichta TaxID=1868482 RepID=A0A1U7T8S1_CARSF|nr:zinc finger and SCAN domain-containing protein 4 [Carlito syrichta]
MALDLRKSLQCEPSGKNLGSENLWFKPSQELAAQKGEGIPAYSSTQFNSFQDSNNSRARQELQRLYGFFHSWLQPEKHSKDEIISQLVVEQFMISGQCNDRAIVKETWKSSGGNLEKFMEDLTDDCLKPPVLVHVYMQGQEALFSEHMPLREVIVHLTNQMSRGTSRGENMGSPSEIPQDTPLETGQEHEDKDDHNISLKTTWINNSISRQGNQIPALLIIQEENVHRSEERGFSCENPHSSKKIGLSASRSQEGSLKGPSYQKVPTKVGLGFPSRPGQSSPDPVPTHQSNEGNSTGGVHQKRSHGAPKLYKCEECPKIFRYRCHLLAHQRRHRNERPFVCAGCHKGFFQASDLNMHQIIHTRQKPFRCSVCEKSFSHKTNLRAHERIHTGEKPYMCPVCERSYRQSSTFHRHMRTHEKITLRSIPFTPETS